MDYTIKLNNDYNSKEIYFNCIPSEEIRAALKALKFRWHNTKKCWYGFANDAEIKNALQGNATAAEPTKENKYNITKEEKEMLIKEWAAVWGDDAKMINYCVNKSDKIIKLSGGRFVVLDKIRLQTHFCFGYGYNGRYDEESHEDAKQAAEWAADPNGEYFIKENTSKLNHEISTIKHALSGEDEEGRPYNYKIILKQQRYCSQKRPLNLYFFEAVKVWEVKEDDTAATPEEMRMYLEALEEQKAELLKRCKTYLKKYSTKKLHIWTFLSD